MANLDLPPNAPHFEWQRMKDWLYKLWKSVVQGLTFGGEANTYSAAIFSSAGQSDPGASGFLGTLGWIPYTPTLTASTGTYTTASALGWYKLVDNIVFLHIKVTITTVGTGTSPVVGRPFPCESASGVFPLLHGRENAVSGKTLNAVNNPGATQTYTVFNYDNTNPVVSGSVCELEGFYIKA